MIYKYDPRMIYTLALGLIAVSALISIFLPRRLLHA
jgi:hypothetical protein